MVDILIDRKVLMARMAENLPILRAKMGCTQEELAYLSGTSRQTVIAMERKQRPMTWSTYLALVTVFSCNDDTKKLMEVMGIFTDQLKTFLTQNRHP